MIFDPTQNNDPKTFIDELTYANYKHNRQVSPHVAPERWQKVYGVKAEIMEERYRMELQ